MLKITRTYFCDFCKKEIEDDIGTLERGRIGYDGENIKEAFQPENKAIRHYCERCLSLLLSLTPDDIKDNTEEELVEDKPDQTQGPEVSSPAPEQTPKKARFNFHQGAYLGPITRGQKDLPALNALLESGRTQTWCSKEFGVSPGTICKWKQEIDAMKEHGTWEAYCEERSTS